MQSLRNTRNGTVDNTTEPMTMESAAESLLRPSKPQETEQVEADEVEAEEVETEEADAGEYADAEEDVDGYENDPDEQDDEDDQEEEVPEGSQTFTVKVDGEDVNVTLEELTRSFSGQKYIQKGMQEAAEQKKQAEAVFIALQQEQARLAQLYQSMQQQGIVPEPKRPDPQMASNDPIGYMQAVAEYDAKKAAYDQQRAEMSHITQQQTAAQQQAMSAYLQEQRQVLQRDIPELADAEKGKQLMGDLRATGERYGFSAEELDQIVDARTVKVLHDAYKWRKLQEGKSKVEQKVKKARPVMTPKAPRKVNAEAKREQEARRALKKSGSVDAAVDWIMMGKQ